jgi:biopolymer transport protein ExbD
MKAVYISMLIVLSLFSCSETRNPNEIVIEITESNQYFINGKLIPESNLKRVLSSKKADILKDGIEESEIVVTLTICKNCKIGAVSNIQTILRKLNLKKLRYTDNGGQET